VVKLRPWQLPLLEHILRHRRCALFAPMGSGKTLAVLTALERLAYVEPVYPVLIIAPLRVARNVWSDEVRKWPHLRHLRVSHVLGTPRERWAALSAPADVYCINYDNLTWLIDCSPSWPFRTVVADEATRLKSFRLRQGGKRAAALAKVAPKTSRWINLTGTPAPNGLIDLWGQTWFLDYGARLGKSFSAFTDRWFQQDWSGYGFTPRAAADRQIHAAIADLCLSIDMKDWVDLREPQHIVLPVALPPAARSLYQSMEREMFIQLQRGEVEAFNAAARTMKCLQIANGAAYLPDDPAGWEVLHDEKLDALEEVVEEAAGAPVLVAYHFKSDLARILARFGKRARYLDSNPRTIEDWNAGRIPVLVAHPASAGHGLNLARGGNILVFFGHWWSLEEHQQIIERIGPMRQLQEGIDRVVFVYHIVATDTIDEDVMMRRRTKASVQDTLMAAMKRRASTA
jgi:SNF2 family DNA or RNA helicase